MSISDDKEEDFVIFTVCEVVPPISALFSLTFQCATYLSLLSVDGEGEAGSSLLSDAQEASNNPAPIINA